MELLRSILMIWTSFTGFVAGLVVSLSKSDGLFEGGISVHLGKWTTTRSIDHRYENWVCWELGILHGGKIGCHS